MKETNVTYPVEPYMEPTSQALVNPSDYDTALTGLEDLDESDLTIPRLKIEHKLGVLKDAQTGMQFQQVFAVVLGLVKQRVLFHPSMETEDEKPMCRAPQFTTGYPNLNPSKPFKAFPWSVAGFDPNSVPKDEEGNLVLPCEACNLKNWGTHPTGDKPYCTEQYTMPLLYAPTLDELQADIYTPALMTIQKTGLKSSKNYLSPFAARKVGVYTAYTRIGLNVIVKGDNQYATPAFTTVGVTPMERHMEFSERFRSLREFVHSSKPRARDTQTPPQQFVAPAVHHAAPQSGPYVNTGQTIPGHVVQNDPWTETQPAQPWPPAQPAPAVQQPPAPQPASPAPQPMQAPAQQPAVQPTPLQANLQPAAQAAPPQMAPTLQASLPPMMHSAPPMPPMAPPMPQAAPVVPAPQPAPAQPVQVPDELDDLPF